MINMRNKLIIAIQIAVTAVLIGATAFAAETGSYDDVASKGYVDEKITQLLTTLETGGIINVNTPVADTSKLKYTPVHVGVGQTLLGSEGTEMILRVGRAFAVVPGKESLIDVTAGKELSDKKELSKHHIAIVPRNDGRGVKVTEDAWFLVKGDYVIK